MRCFIKSATLTVCLAAYCLGPISTASADGGLFSEVAMESVFAASVSKKAEINKKELDEKAVQETRLKKLAELFTAAETEQPSVSVSLLGRWSATFSEGQVFAIDLTSEKKFNLVHLSNGKSTVSSGSFVFAGNQLTLNSTGATPLETKIEFKSSDLFQMKIGSIQLNFKRAK